MSRMFVAVVLALLTMPRAQAEEASWWTTLGGDELHTLVNRAMEDNLTVAIADQGVTRSRAVLKQTQAGLLPVVRASAGMGVLPGVDLPVGATADFTLTGTVPLAVYKAVPARQASLADLRRSEHDNIQTRATTAISVAGLWLDVVLARERADLIDAQISLDQELTDLVESRYRAGATSGTDLLQQQRELASSLAARPGAQAAVHRTFNRLALATQSTPNLARETLPELPAHPDEPDLLRHPSALSATAGHRVARRMRQANQMDLLPDLSAVASSGWSSNLGKPSAANPADGEWTNTWNAGLQLSWGVFDGGRKRATIQGGRGAERESELRVEAILTQLQTDLANAELTLKQRREELELQVRVAETAQESLVAARASYVNGLTSYNTVITVRNSVKRADLVVLLTKRDLLDAWLQLQSLSSGEWGGDLSRTGR